MSDTDPSMICRVSSGWVSLCKLQFLRGYCILRSEPVVASLNELDQQQRTAFLGDMARVGDALMEVTGAYRINYAVLGNTDPTLHAHIVPRYMTEPEELRHGLPWSYPPEYIDRRLFDYEHDRELMQQIAQAINKAKS